MASGEARRITCHPLCHNVFEQDGFLKSTHTLRAQKFLPKRIISRNTAPPVPFLAPIRSATAGRALTRRPFVDRVQVAAQSNGSSRKVLAEKIVLS